MKDGYYIELLKEQIEDKFSQKVTVSNSKLLSKIIFEFTSERISTTTIQRFFELIVNKSKPSLYTLDVLSNFANYNSWSHLKSKNKEETPISWNEKISVDEFGLTLFNLCLKNHNFNTVLEYLDLFPDKEFNYLDQRRISTSLGHIIRKDDKARKKLLPNLAKTLSGRRLFYESFVDIDYLNEYYSKAITNDYIKHISIFNEKKEIDDFVFAKSIEFIGYLKGNQKNDAIKSAITLFKKVSPISDFSIFKHPYPYGRLQSIYIISEALKNNLTLEKIDDIIKRVENVLKSIHINDAAFIVTQIIMALNFVGKYNEVINLYEHYKLLIDSSDKVNTVHEVVFNCVQNSLQKTNNETVIESLHLKNNLIESEMSCNQVSPII